MSEELDRFAAALARKYGIVDTNLLARVLVKAAFDSTAYAHGGGMARAGGRTLPVTGETVAARDRITALVDRLDGELAAALWPLDGVDELRAALNIYRQRLSAVGWSTKNDLATKKPKSHQSTLALILATQWHDLTGEIPKAWRNAIEETASGRFYEFVVDIVHRLRPAAPQGG